MGEYDYNAYLKRFNNKLYEYETRIDTLLILYRESGNKNDYDTLKKEIIDAYCKIGCSDIDKYSMSSELFSNLTSTVMENVQKLDSFIKSYNAEKGHSFLGYFHYVISRDYKKTCVQSIHENSESGIVNKLSNDKKKLPQRVKEIIAEYGFSSDYKQLHLDELNEICDILRKKHSKADYKKLTAEKLRRFLSQSTIECVSMYSDNDDTQDLLNKIEDGTAVKPDGFIYEDYKTTLDMSLVNEILGEDSSFAPKYKKCMKAFFMLKYIKDECANRNTEDYKNMFEKSKKLLKQTSVYDEQVFEAIRCYTLGNKKPPILSVLAKVIVVPNSYFSKSKAAFDTRIKEIIAERRREL